MADSQPSRAGALEEVRALRARLHDLERGAERSSDEAAIVQTAGFMRDVLWICDADLRRFIYVSQAYEGIWGRTCESLYQRPESFLESIHTEDRDRIRRVRGVDASDEPAEERYRIVRPDGAIRWIRDRGFALRDASGSVHRLVGIAEDVTDRRQAEQTVRVARRELEQRVADRTAELTEANEKLRSQIAERKRAEEALRESELWMRNIFHSLEESVLVVTADRRLANVNAAAEATFGYSRDELVNRSTEILHVDREHYLEFGRRIQEAFDRGEAANIEFQAKRKNGAVFPTEHTVSLLKNDAGEPAGIVSVVRDVSERKRAEERERLRQAELARVARLGTMGEMATGIAHELNQPLAAIANYAEACIQRIGGRDPAHADLRSDLEGLAGQTERAGQIIRRLREFVRRGEPRRSTCDINEIVREVVGLMGPEMRMAETALRLELSESLPAVRADSIQVEQVILNLVRNAVEAMSDVQPARRALLIRTATTGDEAVEVAVRDSGQGVDPQTGEQIFDAFFTTKPEGMGMGLSISRTIVAAHGGRLWAAASPGGGAMFRFTLPISGGSKDEPC